MLICCDQRKKVIYVTPGGDLWPKRQIPCSSSFGNTNQQDMETLVLDLARVREFDSFGLRTIIMFYNLLCKSKGELIIENASHELKNLFQLMRIDGRLTISRTGWPG